VLAPILAKLSESEALILSIEVRIPTRAIIPKAMIRKVSTVLIRLALIELNAKNILSTVFIAKFCIFGNS
jgi:hypothetical protein